MKNSQLQEFTIGISRHFKGTPSSIRRTAGTKKAVSIACLFVVAITFCAILPGAFASSLQVGVTSVGSTDYPTATFGNSGTATGQGGGTDILVATKYTLTVDATITKIGAQANAGGKWKIGIYTDDSGKPGTLVIADNDATVVPGDNVFDIGPVFLTAGTYWIATLYNSNLMREYQAGGVQQAAYIVGYGFSNDLPTTFGTPTGYQDNEYVAYCTYVQIEGYAQATKITLTDNNVAITSESFYSHSAGSFTLAIYSDSSGPNSLLWQSPDTAAVVGWNTVPISSGTPGALTLPSGTYWLVWQWNSPNAGPSYTAGSPGDGNYKPLSYGTFPGTLTGGTASSEQWSIYISYDSSIPSTLPEYSWGALLAIALCFAAFAVFVKSRKA